MADNKTNNSRNAVVLEGVYKGILQELDKVKETLGRDIRLNSAQQLSSFEEIYGAVEKAAQAIAQVDEKTAAELEKGNAVEKAVAEVKTTAEATQTAVCKANAELATVKDAIGTIAGAIATSQQNVKESIGSVYSELKYISQQSRSIFEAEEETKAANAQAINKALVSVAEAVKAVSDEQAKTSEALVALGNRMEEEEKRNDERFAELSNLIAEVKASVEKANSVMDEAKALAQDDNFNYELLSQKIVTALPETDYDLIAEKVSAIIPEVDGDAIVDKVLQALPQTDYDIVSDKVASAVPMVDYDLVAEKVAEVIKDELNVTVNKDGVNAITACIVEDMNYEEVAKNLAGYLEMVVVEESQEEVVEPAEEETATAVVEAPVEEAPVEETVEEAVEEPAEEQATEEVKAETSAGIETTTRLKKSFIAKLTQCEEESKAFYSDIKNEFLSYEKVRSQLSWGNERFAYGRDTIAKIGVRGKTLCLYLALDPDEYPTSVYHQKFAGDTKNYESTPMMVKIKSGVALKRAGKLVANLMEKKEVAKSEGAEKVDYTAELAYKTDEQLLEEGQIRTSVVAKRDFDF